jgi:DNA-binding transcriptional LysR family regulator
MNFENKYRAPGDMRALVRVVELRSFSAAAAALGLTPSAVSKLVSKLEDRLGVRLLHRTTRRLTLTAEGEVYFSRAREILAEIEEVETEVGKSRGTPRGRLYVNTSNAFGVHQLVPALPEFLAHYPDVEVELSISDRIVDLVAEHADVIIRAGRLDDMSFSARKFAEFKRTICAAPSYLARCGEPRTYEDLGKHTCISMSVPNNRWPFRTPGGIQYFETISARVATDNGEAALQLALGGVGIVRLADVIVAQPIRCGRLVPLLTDSHEDEPLPISAIFEPGRHRLPKVSVFLDFLMEKFASAPWTIARNAE